MRVDLAHVNEAVLAERKRIANEEPEGNLHLCDQLSYVAQQIDMVQAVADLIEKGIPADAPSLGMAIWDLF